MHSNKKEKPDQTKALFDVFALDVLWEDGDWVENNRAKLGQLEITSKNDCIDERDVLAALEGFRFHPMPVSAGYEFALNTTDRRRVYAEDYYGDGTVWEAGAKKSHLPLYRLECVRVLA